MFFGRADRFASLNFRGDIPGDFKHQIFCFIGTRQTFAFVVLDEQVLTLNDIRDRFRNGIGHFGVRHIIDGVGRFMNDQRVFNIVERPSETDEDLVGRIIIGGRTVLTIVIFNGDLTSINKTG